MRIGINIPNELHQRLEPLKPELNISQVCREALAAKAASHERMREWLGDDGISEVVNSVSERVTVREQTYLSILSAIEVDDWEQLGYEDAVAWVQVAEQEDWDILHRTRKFNPGLSGIMPLPIEGIKFFQNRWQDMYDQIMRQDEDFVDWFFEEHGDIDRDGAEREYKTAWLAYVNAVWDRLIQRQKERREESQVERSQQRQEARRNRTQPQLPEQLLNRLSADYQKIITIELGKRNGQPCIRGMPITVYDVLAYLAGGMTEAEVLADFPELTREDILACYAFAAEPKRRILHSYPEIHAHISPELEAQPDKPPFRVIPHNSGFAPGVDEMQLNRLNSQLEEEELLAKLTGSGTTEPEPEAQSEKPPFRVVPNHSKLAPGVESMNLNHLAAELDDELFLAKMERDRAREREQEKSQ